MSDARHDRDTVDDRPTVDHPEDRSGATAAGATTPRTDATRTERVPEDRHDTTRPVADTRADTDAEHRRDVRTVREPDRARGGFSLWSVLSGVLVAFGSFIIIAALVGAILAAIGITEGGVSTTEATDAGLGAAIGLVIAQLLAYLWGGYTAGRMARGSGVLNGIMVPVIAILLLAVVGAIVAVLVSNTTVDTAQVQMPLPLNQLGDVATGAGIGVLIAMFLGGALGGLMGARWHTKLEDHERVVETRH